MSIQSKNMDYETLTLIHVVVASLFIPYAAANQISCSKDPNVIKLIDGIKYDCCKGNKELRQEGKKCCFEAGEFYFEGFSFCCDGKVVHKNVSHSSSCCNNQVINDNTHICCEQKILALPKGVSRMQTSCCGDKAYDMHKKFCCINTLSDAIKGLRCCGSKVIDMNTSWCKRGKEFPLYFTTCGNQTIDIRLNSCCQGKVNNFPITDPHNMKNENKHHGCCGDRPYNKTTERCCSYDNIIPNKQNVQCCGKSGSFNTKTELCCEGVKHEKKDGFSCCGNMTYDTRIKECCHNHIYLKSTHKCCKDNVHPIATQCCGSERLTSDEICCKNWRTLKKQQDGDNECCIKYSKNGFEMIPFNNAIKGCHSGKLYTKGGDEPCGSGFYNPKKEVCCGHNSYQIPAGQNWSCCGWKPFNEDKQKCCFRVLLNASSREDKCCGIKKTVKQNESCEPQKISAPPKSPVGVVIVTDSTHNGHKVSNNNANTVSQLDFTLFCFVAIVETIHFMSIS